MTNHAPLVSLISFGGMVFTGGGAPSNTDNESTVLTVTESADRPQSVASNQGFGTPQYGYAPGPLKTTTIDCTLVLLAASGLGNPGTWQAVEDAFGVWWNAWCSPYLWDGNTASGQIGDLCVADVSGTTYVAQAELLHLESANVPGYAAEQLLKLSFSLLEPLAAASPAAITAPASTYHMPATRLVSFADMIFTGDGQPDNTDNDSSACAITATVARPRQPVSSTPYGYPVMGLSAGALSTAQFSTTLYLMVAPGLSPAASMQALEDAWNVWHNAWQSLYTYASNSVSGQVGQLVVTDSHGDNYTALAELSDFTAPTQPGEIMNLDIPLTFNLLSQFTAV